MRQWLRSQRTHAKHRTRVKTRPAAVLALATAGAFVIAFPASSAGEPPVVPSCTFPATAGSDSCATLRVNAVTPPIGGALEPVGLGFRFRSQFSPTIIPGGGAYNEITTLILRFDDDILLNLQGIPSCPATELSYRNIAQAWEQCGPGADGNPSSEGNAYLSTALGQNVSGRASLASPTFGPFMCTMIFKGADNTHLTLYLRGAVPSATTGCDNPATNTAGSTTVLFTGNLTHQPAASPYDWTLTVPNVDAGQTAPVEDFYATIRRGAAFRARCPAGVSPHRMQGIWDYTAAGDANDTYLATDPCP